MTTASQAAARILEALEKGPTPGEWMYQGTKAWSSAAGEFVQWGSYTVSANTLDAEDEGYYFIANVSNVNNSAANKANASLISAANPSALRALLAERDELRKALERVVDCDWAYMGHDADTANPDSLYSRVRAGRAVLAALTTKA